MSIRLTTDDQRVALYDTVTGHAFGPTFQTPAQADSFLEFVQGREPLLLLTTPRQLDFLYREWLGLER